MPDTCEVSNPLFLYADGEIPVDWVPAIELQGLELLEGLWEVIPERSDPCDEIMSALGIGALKRTALRNYRTRVEIKIVKDESGNLKIHILTNLPMGFKKEGTVYTDGRSFDQAVSRR